MERKEGPAAGLGRLPAEIILMILDYCHRDDVLALASISRIFHVLTTPILYHDVKIGFVSGDPKLERFKECLAEMIGFTPAKLSYFKNLTIKSSSDEKLDNSSGIKTWRELVVKPFQKQTLPQACQGMEYLESFV